MSNVCEMLKGLKCSYQSLKSLSVVGFAELVHDFHIQGQSEVLKIFKNLTHLRCDALGLFALASASSEVKLSSECSLPEKLESFELAYNYRFSSDPVRNQSGFRSTEMPLVILLENSTLPKELKAISTFEHFEKPKINSMNCHQRLKGRGKSRIGT